LDKSELVEVLKKVYDPEFPLSVIDLKIVNEDDITIEGEKIKVLFTPTSPFCPMGGMIGALIKYALEKKAGKEVEVTLKSGTHNQERMLNEMLKDNQKYKDIIERMKTAGFLEKCVTI